MKILPDVAPAARRRLLRQVRRACRQRGAVRRLALIPTASDLSVVVVSVTPVRALAELTAAVPAYGEAPMSLIVFVFDF